MKIRRLNLALLCAAVVLSFSAQSFAKDTWISVRSKNFFLIGNASEKEIRGVAAKLEQFRETFRQIFPRAKFDTTVRTNVVVFKNSSSYRPFKPKRGDGKADEWIAGYFQSGEDLNYITLSTEGEKADTYGTIFHEYVHFLLNTNFGKSEVPPWFNEGLAEFYQTFEIEDGQKVSLGKLQNGHLLLLQQNQLIPLKTFFEINNYSLHQNGHHSRSIFYAQAWALIHYLIQGNKGANSGNMNKFLGLVMNKVEPEKAFQQAFQSDYATMEKALKKYVEQRTFQGTIVTLAAKLDFDTGMTTVPLTEAETNAYLGDLLYHIHEYPDAESYLQKALAAEPNSSMANTSLGLVKMRQRSFGDARKYLEKAVAADQKNHFAHYNYAYVLSRESMDEFGYISKFPDETVTKMRDSLQKAITIEPSFTESYRLLAFINLVSGENLDESLVFLKKGLSLQPGNQEYALLMAQIYVRQQKLDEAKALAERIVKTASEEQTRTVAQNVLNSIDQLAETKANLERQTKELEAKGIRAPILRRKSTLSGTEIANIQKNNEINGLNRLLEKTKPDETRLLGYIDKVACVKGSITYSVRSGTETLTLTSKDFAELHLVTFIEEGFRGEVGCDARLENMKAVITYRPVPDPKAKTRGHLVSLVFVPETFELRSEEELAKAEEIILHDTEEIPDSGPSQNRERIEADIAAKRREFMLNSINEALRKPEDGEKREIGTIDKIECTTKSVVFHVNVEGRLLKLRTDSPQSIRLATFTPEAGQVPGCGGRMPPVPAVITYRPNDDAKAKQNGDLVAVEFVPASFKLP